MTQSITPDWIAVDWGTSRLRAWAMRGTTVLATAESADGMGGLSRDQFEPCLLDLISDWLGAPVTTVLCCGMVGSRQGWVEAPYETVPAAPLDLEAIAVPPGDPRIRAFVIPGLKQRSPADVMRGEETQIAGFISLNPNWDGVICLPGTHTKWAEISAGEVVSFRTYMSGELFALLSSASVLRHSVGQDGWSTDAFSDAVADAMSRPEAIAARLFSIRARDLLDGQVPIVGRSMLSGYLIGAELAAARPYWLGRDIALIGADAMVKPYADALARQGVPATIADAPRMTLAGLTAARKSLKETV